VSAWGEIVRVLLVVVVISVLGLFGFRTWFVDAAEQFRADYRPTPSSGELPGRYDRVVEVTYMARCQRGTGDVTYCRCTLDKLSAKFSEGRFLRMDAKLAKNPNAKLPKQATRIFQTCERESAES
jgi:hypothetical protein